MPWSYRFVAGDVKQLGCGFTHKCTNHVYSCWKVNQTVSALTQEAFTNVASNIRGTVNKLLSQERPAQDTDRM